MFEEKRKVSVIGLGYVGLPVAVAFGQIEDTVGFDINPYRVAKLKDGLDENLEVKPEELQTAKIQFTTDLADLKQANFHIVTVPTPIDEARTPDLTPIRSATKALGSVLKKGDIVVYESTVYPGVTEEVCVPILEKESGLTCGSDFKVGYSPERINPGDSEHTFTKILKIVSGQDDVALKIVADTYSSVVEAGVYQASSIKVAEAAKVIENTQRDLNIALMNELSLIFDQMNIPTIEVLEAAGTKWNFLNFRPGLVGGHCIGVDPYYLTHKAQEVGYIPRVILSGRQVNDQMAQHIAHRTIKELIKCNKPVLGSCVTVLGVTFKENCPDIRNSKVFDVIQELKDYGVDVQLHDPMASSEEVEQVSGLPLTKWNDLKPSQAIVHAVNHKDYQSLKVDDLKKLTLDKPVMIDVKNSWPKTELEAQGFSVWSL